ncbi:hypothetical protein G7046_g2980 [Stylonectria norvegica]|nr:hypothetical protein G7046_g2980 [Stylonectria norvegica]
MKDQNEVIQEFNELVNMTAAEIEKWLKSDDSNSAGWPKENEDGETVGHDSGRKIVEILKDNPKKDPEKYTEDQIKHMRKVVSYCKRHLAQETKGNNDKSAEEVKKTKSYASLKNWGHDFLKAQGKAGSEKKSKDKSAEDEEVDEKDEAKNGDKESGHKRKASNGQAGSNKKRETRQSGKTNEGKKADAADEEEVSDEDASVDDNKNGGDEQAEENATDEDNAEEDGNDSKQGGKTKKGPKKGDTVSWNWGGGQPEGKVLDVKGEQTSITTKNGNEVSRKGKPDDPAVVLDAGKSKAIKLNHELN